MTVLTNGDRAWLMYLRHQGDAGYSSRSPAYDGPGNAALDFSLSNGQRDEYPASWTISSDAAIGAAEHFFSSGGMDPSVAWHYDSGRRLRPRAERRPSQPWWPHQMMRVEHGAAPAALPRIRAFASAPAGAAWRGCARGDVAAAG
jgi:hypothetical protein